MSREQFLMSLFFKLLFTLHKINQQVSVFKFVSLFTKLTVGFISKQQIKFRLPLAFVFNKHSVYFLYSFHFLC